MRVPSFRRQPAFHYPEILPESVRNALGHNGAKLSRTDIEKGLLANDRFKNLGFYMLMKATDDQDAIQAGLLDMMSATGYNFAQLDREDAPVQRALEYLDDREQPFVQGEKLAMISRYGFTNWLDNFDRALRPAMEGDSPPELYIVANSTYVGLDRIASLSVMEGGLLRVLKPSRFDSPQEPIGFTLPATGSSEGTTPLPHGFERPENALVFDDVTNQGAVRDQVMNVWGDGPKPEFVAGIVKV